MYPFVACYATTGAFRRPRGRDDRIAHHCGEIHVARKSFLVTLRRSSPTGNWSQPPCSRFPPCPVRLTPSGQGIGHTFGGMAWGGQETVGWRLLVPVKIQSTL